MVVLVVNQEVGGGGNLGPLFLGNPLKYSGCRLLFLKGNESIVTTIRRMGGSHRFLVFALLFSNVVTLSSVLGGE